MSHTDSPRGKIRHGLFRMSLAHTARNRVAKLMSFVFSLCRKHNETSVLGGKCSNGYSTEESAGTTARQGASRDGRGCPGTYTAERTTGDDGEATVALGVQPNSDAAAGKWITHCLEINLSRVKFQTNVVTRCHEFPHETKRKRTSTGNENQQATSSTLATDVERVRSPRTK